MCQIGFRGNFCTVLTFPVCDVAQPVGQPIATVRQPAKRAGVAFLSSIDEAARYRQLISPNFNEYSWPSVIEIGSRHAVFQPAHTPTVIWFDCGMSFDLKWIYSSRFNNKRQAERKVTNGCHVTFRLAHSISSFFIFFSFSWRIADVGRNGSPRSTEESLHWPSVFRLDWNAMRPLYPDWWYKNLPLFIKKLLFI